MPRSAKGLTAKKVKDAPTGRHADGMGLYLVVDESGAKRWIVRVHVKGQLNSGGKPKRAELGIGSAKLVPLPEAREIALNFQKLAKKGIDPRSLTKNVAPNFKSVARAFFEQHKKTLSNPKHAAQWITTLENYAFPTIGNLPIDQVTHPQILQCIEPLWYTKHETATRVMQRIAKVLDVATAKGLRSGDNPVTIIKNANALPARNSSIVSHHPSMPFEQLPEFFVRLKEQDGAAAMALQFTILTASRTSETLNATWNEFDLDSCVWSLEPCRMKANREHVVPLTESCINILSGMKQHSQSDWVFEGMRRGKPLSNMAMANVLKRMEITDATVHGFRTSFRTWCGHNGIEREIAELCLAHQIGNAVEQAYNRSDYLERRRDVMQRWECFILGD
jgi:integrase